MNNISYQIIWIIGVKITIPFKLKGSKYRKKSGEILGSHYFNVYDSLYNNIKEQV